MAGKNTTISNVQPVAGNLRVQTSVYGAAIPLIYGTTRVSGNLLWMGGFTAVPHTSTTTSGGKGGGGKVKQVDTSYTYTAALLMALGEGPLNNVLSAWKSKTRFSGIAAASVPVTYQESFTVPPGGICTVAHAATFLNNVQVTNQDVDSWDNTWQNPGLR